MPSSIETLMAILQLEPLGEDRWRGIGSSGDGAEGTYGGHFLGQASMAALASADAGRSLHSLHAYFLRGGQPGMPIDYAVTRVRDGRSFCSRRVSAWQDDRLLFEMTASLAVPEDGCTIRPAPPADFDALPEPESLPRYREVMAAADPMPFPADWALREHGIDLRPVNAPWCERGVSPDGGIRHWIRADGILPDDPALHTAALAYQSDESVSDNLLVPFDVTWCTPGTTFLSLDHAMWIHGPVRMNEWMFVEQWPGPAEGARGLAHGRVWTRSGTLVASFSQEALMRLGDYA